MILTKFTNKPLVAAVFATMSILLSGVADTSVAIAATACNTTDFSGFYLSAVDGRTTYAVTKNVLTWNDAQTLAQNNGGRLVTVTSAEQNAEISAKLAAQFTVAPAPSSGNKAWVGLLDLANTAAWTMEGSVTPTLTPDRFQWASGGASYTNYAAGQPDDYCTNAEKQVHPDRICYGENWVAMNADGTWADEGDHGTTPIKLKGIVEWPNTMLDCVTTTTSPITTADQTLPDTTTGTLYCKDQAGLNITQCIKASDGTDFCPQDQIACSPIQATDPPCDTANGYSWNSSSKRCEYPASADYSCPSGGTRSGDTCTVTTTTSAAYSEPRVYDVPVYSECDTAGVPSAMVGTGWPSIQMCSLVGYAASQPFSGSEPIYWAPNSNYITKYGGYAPLYGYISPTDDYYAEAVPVYADQINNVYDMPVGSVYPVGWLSYLPIVLGGYSCPTGTLSGNVCSTSSSYPAVITDPVCGGGGTYDSTATVCYTSTHGDCPNGTTWDPTLSKCVTPAICPTVGTNGCHAIPGDTTLDTNGQPVLWCSPDQCQSDTAGMITNVDVPPQGTNDLTDDGARNADGTCAGQMYIFNGRDMRCTKDDIRGMIGSIAKIGAALALSFSGLGAALAGSMLGSMGVATTATVTLATGATATVTTTAMSVATSMITAVATSAVGLGIDAATTGIQPGWALQAGMQVAMAGIMAYVSSGLQSSVVNNADGSVTRNTVQVSNIKDYTQIENMTKDMTSVSVPSGSEGLLNMNEMYIDPGPIVAPPAPDMFGNVVTTGTSVFVDYGAGTVTKVISSTTMGIATYLSKAQEMLNTFAPAIEAGMTASYSEKKCCHPDKVSPSCEQSEMEEWGLQGKGSCHKIGTYCDTKFLGMCMAHKETSCCFASKLARIIHEQGRPQLKSFGTDGGWGSAKSPNCRGMTPEEFQLLDFNQIDLSEYVADVTANINALTPDITNYMNSVSDGVADRSLTLTPAGDQPPTP